MFKVGKILLKYYNYAKYKYYSEITPSILETCLYFSTTFSGVSIVTFIETLVKVPFEESLVVMAAPIPSNIASMSAIF